MSENKKQYYGKITKCELRFYDEDWTKPLSLYLEFSLHNKGLVTWYETARVWETLKVSMMKANILNLNQMVGLPVVCEVNESNVLQSWRIFYEVR